METAVLHTLPEVSDWQAKHRGDSTAFVFEERTTSFKQFNVHANQVANGLLAEKLNPHARVAMISKDSDWGYEILFGCAKAKHVLIGINWRLAAQEILYILNEGEAEIIFVGEEFISIIESIEKDLIWVKKIIAIKGNHAVWNQYENWRSMQSSETPALTYHAEDVVVQMYTSGTTGLPKGVQLAHYSFFRLLQGMKAKGDLWMDLNEKDTLLIGVPMFHIGGMWWGIQGFIAGASGIILDVFIAWKVLECIEKYQITKVAMVPAMIQFCLAEPSCKTTDFSSLKYILYGGSPITPTLLNKAIEVFSCEFFQIYGMTETGNCAVTLRPSDHDRTGLKRRNAAGKPFPGVEVKVIDRNGNTLAAGQTGEICIKSPSVMLGYWKNEKATNETLSNGWIHTGDGGYVDEDGYVYVCDRIKDMIISAGENVFPAEVEAALAEHDAVKEVAVIGIPDELWGEAVKAFVVLKPNASVKQRELINFARTQIADFKVPKSISFVESLPRNPAGKVLKRILREPFWQGRERLIN